MTCLFDASIERTTKADPQADAVMMEGHIPPRHDSLNLTSASVSEVSAPSKVSEQGLVRGVLILLPCLLRSAMTPCYWRTHGWQGHLRPQWADKEQEA